MNIQKEKAKELVSKFYKYAREDSSGFMISNEDIYIKSAIKCAIICVDEIIESLEEYDDRTEEYLKQQFGLEYFSHEKQNMDSSFRYWEKVKKELELL